MQVNKAKVKRDGKIVVIDSKDVVVGDILILEAGDFVCADARIIKASSLKVDESALTGESIQIDKDFKKLNDDLALSERTNMVYMGTNVTYGHGEAVVCNTGMSTEFGKIAEMLKNEDKELTPLQKKIEEISRVLSFIIMVIIFIMFFIGLFKGMKILEILMLSLSLAVAAIPEGLPAIITITLSLGIYRMAQKKAIVRKMTSVETLGCTEIICSDKTGTITQNLMSVEKIYLNNSLKSSLKGDELLLKMMALNNDAVKNDSDYIGDSTEIALLKYAEKYLDIDSIINNYPRILDIPFDSDRKMMSTLNKFNDNYMLFVKGSFDSIISRCSKVVLNGKEENLTDDIINELRNEEKNLSSKAYRILAFAYRKFEKSPKNLNIKHVSNLVFVALVCMIDPPRLDVKDAIMLCKDANIKPIMITGDSLGIGIAIAKKVGIIKNNKEAILGSELEKYKDEELKEIVSKYSVYARVTPSQKLKIVNALKANGKVVAMTGDGVNDAPAIKNANIGIGMGITGTDVSKNVSDIILSDDSFSTIVSAVKEGRRIYDNIRNVLVYLLTGNVAEVFIVFIGMLFGLEIFVPIQLLYINLITDSLPAIALAFEDEDPNIMHRSVRQSNNKFFTSFLIAKIGFSSFLKTLAILIVYFVNNKIFGIDNASSMAFLTLILLEMSFAYSCRNLKVTLFEYNFIGNKYLNYSMLILLFINLIVFLTPIKSVFGIVSLNGMQYLYCLLLTLVIIVVDEISKPFIKRQFKDNN